MAETRNQSLAEKELFHNESQKVCFICRKDLLSLESQNVRSQHSIRMVFRHLKINHPLQIYRDNEHPVELSFCEHCYQIFKTLSSYCEDYELLQMRIQYYINKLNTLTVVEESITKLGAIGIARKQLKARLVEKCASFSSSGPLVILRRLDLGQIGNTSCPATGTNSISVLDDESSRSNEDLNTSRSIKTPKVSVSKKLHPCFECGSNLKSKSTFLKHSTVFHPEKYFPPKSEDLTTTQHKMYLTHLLNTEIDYCGSWKSGYSCLYCSKAFKKRKRQFLRVHLVNHHKDKLLNNLVQLQKDVSTELISSVVKMPIPSHRKSKVLENKAKLKQLCKAKNRMRFEFTCSICGVCTTSLRQHSALHHPENILLPKRLEKVTQEQFKRYCVYLINKQVDNFTKSQLDGKMRFHCTHCEKSFTDLQSCRNHLVLKHSDHLAAEIEKLQHNMTPEEIKNDEISKSYSKYCVKPINRMTENSTMKCEICGVRLTQRGMTFHLRKSHPNEYSKAYNCKICLICNQSFRYKWSFNFHTMRFHADMLFENWKTSLTTTEQFKLYCDNLVETEINRMPQVSETDGKIRYQCLYCTTKVGDTKYARIHLVKEHKEIIGSRLGELQKGRTVRTEEQPQEEVSEEKIGEQDYFEATEVFCDKSAAKHEYDDIVSETDQEMESFTNYDCLNEANSSPAKIGVQQEDSELNANAILPD